MAFFLGNVLGASNKIVSHYRADKSGTAYKAVENSNVEETDRVYFHTVNTFRKFFTGKHLKDISARFLGNLERNLAGLITDSWVEFDDLYDFLQEECGKAAVEATMGSKILELNPTLMKDIRDFKQGVPSLLRCIPCWLLPRTYRARARLQRSILKWHDHARRNSDCSRTQPKDPEWEPYFGSKLVRARQYYLSRMEWMDNDAQACEDMGLLYT
jgi:hypothetical protein